MKDALYVDGASLNWRPTPSPGVEWKKLYFDRASGRSVVLLRFAAGASYAAHRHPRGESYYVLEGELEDGAASYAAGSFARLPPGSAHRPISRSGCIVLVWLDAPIEVLD